MDVEPVSVRKPLSEGDSEVAVVALVVSPATVATVAAVVVVADEDVDTCAQAVAPNSRADVSNAETMHFIFLFIVFLLFIDGSSIPIDI
jgi:hypothetical protein